MERATKVPSNASAALKVGEFGFPAGHLGYLTASQESALEEFKKILAKQNLYKPAADGQPPSHSDALLLRFVRARRFVPQDALQQFKDTEKWRTLNELDSLYMNIDVDDYDTSRRHYPQWVGRRDKRGIPVYLYQVGALDSKTMAVYTKSSSEIHIAGEQGDHVHKQATKNNKAESSNKTPPRLLRLFALYENLAGFMTMLCTILKDRPNPEVPVTQSNNIVDVSRVGLKQFWNLRGHMQDASVLATAHYPETLDRIFIVGAPSFFPTVWSWIKRWFDPITVSKIFILNDAQTFPTLSTFIDPACIPKRYGGTLDFSFGDLAPLDPAYADKLVWRDDGSSGPTTAKGEVRRWPRGPIQWVERDDGDLDLMAVGSVGGKPRREVVATLKLDGQRGGWADKSVPVPAHSAGEKDSAAIATTNGELPAGEKPEKDEGQENGHAASTAVAAPNGHSLMEEKPEPDAKPQIEKVTEDEQATVAAAAAIVSTAQIPAVEPVPFDAVAKPLPGDDNREAVATGQL